MLAWPTPCPRLYARLPACTACRYAEQYCNDIADLLAPQSGAYYDVWLDGEKFYSHTMEVGGRVGGRAGLRILPVAGCPWSPSCCL